LIGTALCAGITAMLVACSDAGVNEAKPVSAGAAAKPVKLSRAQLAGGVFADFEAVIEKREHEGQTWTTEDVEAFVSSDKKFDAGVFRSEAVRSEITEPYGVDEFMYFLEGGVTLTSSDGTRLEIVAGDAVMIPKEWRGVWDTKGYLKIYVIHYQTPLE
jgi:uncharacterized cupin superfamily protein